MCQFSPAHNSGQHCSGQLIKKELQSGVGRNYHGLDRKYWRLVMPKSGAIRWLLPGLREGSSAKRNHLTRCIAAGYTAQQGRSGAGSASTKIVGPVKGKVVVGHRVTDPTAASFPAVAPFLLIKEAFEVFLSLPLVYPRAHFFAITVVP